MRHYFLRAFIAISVSCLACVLIVSMTGCSHGPAQPSDNNSSSITLTQLWAFKAAGQTAYVEFHLGTSGNGTLQSAAGRTQWVQPEDFCPGGIPLTISGTVNPKGLSFTTNGSGCLWQLQGTATGTFIDADAPLAAQAGGTIRQSNVNTAHQDQSGVATGSWTASRIQ